MTFKKGNPYRFAPGISGNTKGKGKKETTISHYVKKMLCERAAKYEHFAKMADGMGLDVDKVTVGAVLASRMILKAMVSTSPGFLIELLNRTEGKVPQITQLNMSVEEKAEGIRQILAAIETAGGIPDDDTSGNPEQSDSTRPVEPA